MLNSTVFTKLHEVYGDDDVFVDSSNEGIICLTADIMSTPHEFEEISLPEGVEWGIAMGDDHPHCLIVKVNNKLDDEGHALMKYIEWMIGRDEEE